MKILILTSDGSSDCVELVQAYLIKQSHLVVRFNVRKLISQAPQYKIEITNQDCYITAQGERHNLKSFAVIWKRRFGYNFQGKNIDRKSFSGRSNNLFGVLNNEVNSIQDFILQFARDNSIPVINDYSPIANNKISQLVHAELFELNVPKFVISNESKSIVQFVEQVGSSITKAIKSYPYLSENGRTFTPSTSSLILEDLYGLRETIFPTLVQQQISSNYELKCILVGDRIHAVKQSVVEGKIGPDIKTHFAKRNVDLREYQFPCTIEGKLLKYLKYLHLDFCTFDIIADEQGNYVFIEINPDGIIQYYSEYIISCNVLKEMADYICSAAITSSSSETTL